MRQIKSSEKKGPDRLVSESPNQKSILKKRNRVDGTAEPQGLIYNTIQPNNIYPVSSIPQNDGNSAHEPTNLKNSEQIELMGAGGHVLLLD